MGRVHNLTKWKLLNAGAELVLPGTEGRSVRVEVNVTMPTVVHLLSGDDDNLKLTLIGRVDGLDFVEFTAPQGDLRLTFDTEGEVWYFTNDGKVTAHDVSDQKHWTNVMTREQRNPQQDLMMWQMQQNAKRRERELQAEIARMQEREADRLAQEAALAEAEAKASAAAKAEQEAAAAAKAAAEAAAKVPPVA